MIKYFFITLTIISLVSCDTREDYYLKIDKSPFVGIKRDIDTSYVSEINDSNKIGVIYKINIKFKDEEQLKLKVIKNFSEDSVNIVNNLAFIHNNKAGNCSVGFFAIDSYGKKSTAKLNIVSFKNLPPVADFFIKKNIGTDSTLIIIDASKSFDQDAKWGGHIILYEYTVNGQVSQNSLNSFTQIFYSKGQKRVTLRVLDNDGAWSEEKTIFVTI